MINAEKSKKINELGEKPIGKLLLQYATPAIVAMAASSIYNIIDGIFIGQGVGPNAIMGLALTNPLMALTIAVGAMVGVGGATLMSVRLGQKDYESAIDILVNVVFLNLIMGSITGGILLWRLKPILEIFGASEVTIKPAYDFMQILLLGNVVTHMYFGLNALLRSTNRPRQAMYATFGTVILNCALAPLFIFIFHWGIRGAAAATLFSQFIMMCWEIYLFSDNKNLVHWQKQMPRIRRRIMSKSLIIGLPQFLINLSACLIATVITWSMTRYGSMTKMGGDIAVGSFGIANRLIMLIIMLNIGLNQGMQPIAGFNYGAEKINRLIEVLKKALIFATVITTSGFLIYMIFAYPLAELFAKNASLLIKESAHGLRIMVSTFPLVGIQIIATAFFQSIGYAGKSIFLALTRQLIFLLPGLLIFPHVFTNPVDGIWYAMPIANMIAACIATILLLKEVRKLKQRLLASPASPEQ